MYLINFFIFRNEKAKILRFPRTPDQLRELVSVVKEYTNTHFFHVLTFFITLYLL
jgi:hypothetical protein